MSTLLGLIGLALIATALTLVAIPAGVGFAGCSLVFVAHRMERAS